MVYVTTHVMNERIPTNKKKFKRPTDGEKGEQKKKNDILKKLEKSQFKFDFFWEFDATLVDQRRE